MTDNERRDHLALFGITGDTALQTIRQLSGGERNRVALARLAASEVNFLALDEPTNHLDLWARQSLERALRQFEGTVLLVSHDRYFLNEVCDHLLVFESDRVRLIDGNYDTYRQLVDSEKRRTLASENAAKEAKPPKSSNDRPTAGRWKFAYRKVEEIEAEIAERESTIERLHRELADPEVLRDRDKVLAAKGALADQSQKLEVLYEHWEEAHLRN